MAQMVKVLRVDGTVGQEPERDARREIRQGRGVVVDGMLLRLVPRSIWRDAVADALARYEDWRHHEAAALHRDDEPAWHEVDTVGRRVRDLLPDWAREELRACRAVRAGGAPATITMLTAGEDYQDALRRAHDAQERAIRRKHGLRASDPLWAVGTVMRARPSRQVRAQAALVRLGGGR